MKLSFQQPNRRVYYGGFDPGSGFAELWVTPADNPQQMKHMVIPSWVASGTLADIAKRSRTIGGNPMDELESDEFVIQLDNMERYVGRLAQNSGTNGTNAFNDPRRYTNEHAQMLLLAMAGLLIPEDQYCLKYVTALPVSLYDDQRRVLIQDTFTRNFRYHWNGRYKEADLVVGAVVPEGTGALVLYGDTSSRTLVVDYGYRTTDVLAALGQKIDFDRSGGIQIGVGQLIDAFNDEFYRIAGRRLREEEAEPILHAYVHEQPLPVVRSNRRVIDEAAMRTALYKVYTTIGMQANTKIAGIVNEDESGQMAADYDLVIPIGGGAHHFRRMLEVMIPNVEYIDNPQSANPEGYMEIAMGFSNAVWTKVLTDVMRRTGRVNNAW
ncbi:MAG TPA: ParM/StbA family protein [Ktedonobacteraceae bacterium]|nr:ParM/StbA family protein [Ktedonobacteraceae bacterium]